MTASVDDLPADVTDDAFLGGALRLLQPARGYRAGIDALLLAAALPVAASTQARVIDVGAGVGTAGLAAARRCPTASVVLLEREPALVALAERNIARNGLSGRVETLAADLGSVTNATLEDVGCAPGSFDHAIANPPYHTEGKGTASASKLRKVAHEMPPEALVMWVRFLARMVRPGGTAAVIHRAGALPELLGAMAGRFGALSVRPIYAEAAAPAIRIIVQGVQGSRAPPSLLPGFLLHDASGEFTPEAREIFRNSAALT